MSTDREVPKCELCGEPMPEGESMFKFHGYSGPCPKEPLPRPAVPADPAARIQALERRNAALVEVLRGIADAKRFDRAIFDCDDAFIGWAQSIARHALAANEAPL